MRTRPLLAALVLVLAGPALADPPPVPPADHPPVLVEPGKEWTAPEPPDGWPADARASICLDPVQARYQHDTRVWTETYAREAREVAEESFLRGGAVGVAVGVAVGLAAGGYIAWRSR